MVSKREGFTLLETLVVVAVIVVIATMAITFFNSVRIAGRDSKRVADMSALKNALELFYTDNKYYPTLITAALPLQSPDGTKVYIASVPTNPTPRSDNNCANSDYTYAATSDNTNYSINFCLGRNVGTTPLGVNTMSSEGIGTAPNLATWFTFYNGIASTVYDATGNGKNGTVTGSLQYGTESPHYYAIFDGNDYVRTTNSYPPANSSVTISLWLKYGAGHQAGLAAYTKDNTTATMFELEMALSGAIRFIARKGTGNIFDLFSPAASVTPNTWYHVVGVYDKVTGGKIYVNGVSVATNASTGLYDMSGGFISMGENPGAGSRKLTGWLSDVRFYQRALSQTEVTAIYNATR